MTPTTIVKILSQLHLGALHTFGHRIVRRLLYREGGTGVRAPVLPPVFGLCDADHRLTKFPTYWNSKLRNPPPLLALCFDFSGLFKRAKQFGRYSAPARSNA